MDVTQDMQYKAWYFLMIKIQTVFKSLTHRIGKYISTQRIQNHNINF